MVDVVLRRCADGLFRMTENNTDVAEHPMGTRMEFAGKVKLSANDMTRFFFLGYHCELDLPASRPTAVVVSLHGYGGNATSTPQEVREAYLRRGWAVCRPEAHPDALGKPSWNVGYPSQSTMEENDTEWLSALAGKLRCDFNVEKVFLTGMSNGGEMCYQMFYLSPKAYDAIASVAGLTMKVLADSGSPRGGVPFLEIHGTADEVSRYGGLNEPNYWGEYLAVPDAVKRVESANVGFETTLVTIDGAGHQWTTPLYDIPAATADFFARQM